MTHEDKMVVGFINPGIDQAQRGRADPRVARPVGGDAGLDARDAVWFPSLMSPVAPAIRAIFPLFSDIVFDAALDAGGISKDDPAHQPFLPGYRQLMDGFRDVILESLDGPEREKRTKYIAQTVPSLLQQTELEALVDRTVSFGIRLTNAVVLRLPAHQREQATAWFAEFFGSYMAELVHVGRASAER